MGWNYRVIVRDMGGELEYGLHEVYYEDDGRPRLWSVNSIRPHGESVEGLREDLEWMMKGLSRPVLREKEDGDRTILVEAEDEVHPGNSSG